MTADGILIPVALATYLLATGLSIFAAARARSFMPSIVVLAAALIVHSLAIAIRWIRLDHGPYVDMYEILSSNVWSLHLAVLMACIAIPKIRPALATAMPVLQVYVIWHFLVPPTDTVVPVTYDTIWLPIHVLVGKVFLGCIVVAVALSIVVLVRRGLAARSFANMPAEAALDELAYRFVMLGFIFQCFMLIVGAIWARNAWGRYWAWDPLETWAFITWLSVVFYLHLRAIRRPDPALSACLVLIVYGLAVFTFFGVPFVSTAPHKGAI